MVVQRPTQTFILEFYGGCVFSGEFWNVEPLVVLFVGCANDNLLFFMVNMHLINVLSEKAIPDSPLEVRWGVFSHEYWLHIITEREGDSRMYHGHSFPLAPTHNNTITHSEYLHS